MISSKTTATHRRHGPRPLRITIKNDIGLYMMLLIPVAIVIIFRYLPIFGAMIAFKNYDFTKGILGSEWVGLKWFIRLFTQRRFTMIFTNTLMLSFYTLLFSFPFPVILALSLNEVKNGKFKRLTQTFSYLPYFLSTVVVVGLLNQVLNPTSGVVNMLIVKMGGTPINFIALPRWFRTTYVLSDIWTTMGYNSIIYLSAFSGISMELYEAAVIDGANRWGQMRNVTLPGILPTIMIMFLMSLGTLLGIGYEKAFLMQNDLNLNASEIIGTYVYKQGLGNLNYENATAAGLFQSTLNLILVTAANVITRKAADISLW